METTNTGPKDPNHSEDVKNSEKHITTVSPSIESKEVILKSIKDLEEGTKLFYDIKEQWLWENEDFVEVAFGVDSWLALTNYVNSEKIRDNDRLMLIAVENNPNSLEYATDRLKSNFSFMMEAVKINGFSYGYASKELQMNKSIILTAIIYAPKRSVERVLDLMSRENLAVAGLNANNLPTDEKQIRDLAISLLNLK